MDNFKNNKKDKLKKNNFWIRKTDVIINPDFISNYRTVLLDKLLKVIKNKKLNFIILSNSKSYFNLKISKDYLLKKEYKKSNPIFFFNHIIWQPFLIRLFLFKRPKFYIVWGEVTRLNSWILLILKKTFFKSSKIYLWTHGIYGRENIILKKLRAFHFNMGDLLLVYSEYSKKVLIQNGIKSSKIKIIGNQLPKAEEYLVTSKKKDRSNTLNLIFVGRMSKKKKIDLVIELVKNWSISEKFFLKLIIIGPNNNKKIDNSYLNSSITYIPEIYEPKLLFDYFSKSDFGICPDNIGLFCLSSILSGLPLITHTNNAYHGPESAALKKGINLVPLNFPVEEKDLKLKLYDAYKQKKIGKFCPKVIRDSLPVYFTSIYQDKILGELF